MAIRIVQNKGKDETEIWNGDQFIGSWNRIFLGDNEGIVKVMLESAFEAGKHERSHEIKKLVY